MRWASYLLFRKSGFCYWIFAARHLWASETGWWKVFLKTQVPESTKQYQQRLAAAKSEYAKSRKELSKWEDLMIRILLWLERCCPCRILMTFWCWRLQKNGLYEFQWLGCRSSRGLRPAESLRGLPFCFWRYPYADYAEAIYKGNPASHWKAPDSASCNSNTVSLYWALQKCSS